MRARLLGALLILVGFLGPGGTAMAVDLGALAAPILAREGVSGAGLALVGKAGALAAGGVGLADREHGISVDEDTRFLVGSISKTFVALSLLALVEDGKLRLDSRVLDLAPELPLENPWRATAPVTVAHLLEHTTGAEIVSAPWFLRDGEERPSLAQLLLGDAFHRRVVVPPGTMAHYDHYGYLVGAYLVEKLSGLPYAEYLRRRILLPLGMTETGFVADGTPGLAKGYMKGSFQPIPFPSLSAPAVGGLATSVRDMVRFVRFLLGEGELDGKRVLSPELVRRAERPETSRAAAQGVPIGYGLGLETTVGKYGLLAYHGGIVDGYSAMFGYDRQLGVGYVYLSNATAPMGIIGKAPLDIFEALQKDFHLGPTPAVEAEVALSADDAARLPGDYVNVTPLLPQMRFIEDLLMSRRVTVRDGKAYVKPLLGPETRLIPVRGGAFRDETRPLAWAFLLAEPPHRDEPVLVLDQQELRRVPPGRLLAFRLGFALTVTLLVSSPLLLWRRRDTASLLAVASAAAALAQLASFLWLVHVETMSYASTLNAATLTFFAAPCLQALLGVAALLLTLRPRWSRFQLAVALACCALPLILAPYGLVGMRLWS